jgi:F-type H+-transporting ATPase subunit b
MPQFQLANALPQVAWLILIFLLLYLAVSALLPGVARVVENRKAAIAADLAAAEQARLDARAAAERMEAQLKEARAAAMSEAAAAKLAAERAAAERMRGLDDELAAKIAAAERELADQRSAAVASLDGLAIEAAQRIVERLTGIAPGADLVRSAVAQTGAR